MRRVIRSTSGVVAVCIALGQYAVADERNGKSNSLFPLQVLTCPDALLRTCCPLYSAKPLPHVHSFCRACCPNTYSKKPCPCVRCYPGSCRADCYSPKPCPDLCRPLAADNFIRAGKSADSVAWGASSDEPPMPQLPFSADEGDSSESGADPVLPVAGESHQAQ